jgi:hypothetical protein
MARQDASRYEGPQENDNLIENQEVPQQNQENQDIQELPIPDDPDDIPVVDVEEEENIEPMTDREFNEDLKRQVKTMMGGITSLTKTTCLKTKKSYNKTNTSKKTLTSTTAANIPTWFMSRRLPRIIYPCPWATVNKTKDRKRQIKSLL